MPKQRCFAKLAEQTGGLILCQIALACIVRLREVDSRRGDGPVVDAPQEGLPVDPADQAVHMQDGLIRKAVFAHPSPHALQFQRRDGIHWPVAEERQDMQLGKVFDPHLLLELGQMRPFPFGIGSSKGQRAGCPVHGTAGTDFLHPLPADGCGQRLRNALGTPADFLPYFFAGFVLVGDVKTDVGLPVVPFRATRPAVAPLVLRRSTLSIFAHILLPFCYPAAHWTMLAD